MDKRPHERIAEMLNKLSPEQLDEAALLLANTESGRELMDALVVPTTVFQPELEVCECASAVPGLDETDKQIFWALVRKQWDGVITVAEDESPLSAAEEAVFDRMVDEIWEAAKGELRDNERAHVEVAIKQHWTTETEWHLRVEIGLIVPADDTDEA
jgi:hypothetical protein